MKPIHLTYETTASEAALTHLIYVHLIRGSARSGLIIVTAAVLLVIAALVLSGDTSDLEVFERPIEAVLLILGTFGSWMFMQFWNFRRALMEDIGPLWRIALRLDDLGAHWLVKGGDETMKWDTFRTTKTFGGRLFLLPKSGGHIALYARAFPSRADFEAYALSVHEAIRQSSAPANP